MRKLLVLLAVPMAVAVSRGEMVVSPWTPIFQGIEHAVGTNFADAAIPRLQVANCVRVDLTEPGVRLFPTPRDSDYVADFRETRSLSVSNFIKIYGLAVAADANFYSEPSGNNDPASEGLPMKVFSLQICTGSVVSVSEPGPDSNGRYASLLFTSNQEPVAVFDIRATNMDFAGIYTAVTGYYPVLSNGVNIGADASASYPDPTVHQPQPRTVFGISEDRRYLFMVTIDGRQPGYSEGATDSEIGEWMLQFGAWDAINMDGGGSTAMYKADCAGLPVPLNRSSYVPLRGRERYIGSHFGVFARPLPTVLKDLTAVPGMTTALITWTTDQAGTTQVEYGPSPSYGSMTAFEARPTKTHIATLNGLLPGNNYFYRAMSIVGTETQVSDCRFQTTNQAVSRTLLFDLNNSWTYTTNNLDGVNWRATGYDDSGWLGQGPGALYTETANLPPYPPLLTVLPPGVGVSPVPRTYYFRTRFTFSGGTAGRSLTFSNYIDDGAVFYLNGGELLRTRMPPAPTVILNATAASSPPCQGDANLSCPDLVTLDGSRLANLVEGTNVLAVELHNLATGADVLFASALYANTPSAVLPLLHISMTDNLATLYWNGAGFTLQQSSDLSSTNSWLDAPGPVIASPAVVTNAGTLFYRLRQ